MKIFVVSAQQQNLVSVDFTRMWRFPIFKRDVSNHDLKSVYTDSSLKPLFACTDINEAVKLLHCLKLDPTTWANYHSNERGDDIQIFSSPVIFTLEMDDEVLNQSEMELNAADLYYYGLNLHRIPLFPVEYINLEYVPKAIEQRLNETIAQHAPGIKIRKLEHLNAFEPENALYLDADGERLINVDFATPTPPQGISCNLL